MYIARLVLCLLCSAAAFVAHAQRPSDLHFSEAFFYAQQGDYFSALQRMDTELLQHHRLDEPHKDSLYPHIGEAEFSVGDFELNYRMHHRAGRAIRAVLEGNVSDPVRNEAAYRLARIHFQKGQMQEAVFALDRIEGEVDNQVAAQTTFLRANIYLAQGRPAEAAEILGQLQSSAEFNGFAAYNLGVAYWRTGERERAFDQLSKAGTIKASVPAERAIKDKANLVLGSLLMETSAPATAVPALQRVRLQGPFANQALLSAGWADVHAGQFERAIVPWNILAQRDSTQAAVQEARLALPYAYGQLNVHGRAAVLYSNALNTFGTELTKLDSSIESIQSGRFLEVLVREEIHHDKDWVIRLRDLPQTPETYYLIELMASHEFHTALQNFLDLEALRLKLKTWQRNFIAYDDLLKARLSYFEPRLPPLDDQFRALDSRIKLRRKQAQLIEKRKQDLLTTPRPELLATTAEATAHNRLERLRIAVSGSDDVSAATRQRIERLQGVLTWTLHTQYHKRLTDLHEHLAELQAELVALDESYLSFVRVRQAATHSFQGYDEPFNRLSRRVDVSLDKLEGLMRSQGELLERVAVAELKRRQERLQEYQNTARFAMADSYDRATKALQAGGQ